MKAKLGQNFLADPSVLAFEAKAAGVKGKSVLEIGAGDGRLTEKLLSEGAGHITAIEIDPKLAKQLRMKFSARLNSRVRVLEQDFLSFSQDRKYNVIMGNIPYYITSPILFKISKMDFDIAILCIQKEVAERMLAPAGTSGYGRLSVSTQLVFETELLASVGREAFSPRPRVDSCIISLRKTGFSLSEQEEKAIGSLFSHKKKSLKNAVVDARQGLFGSSDKKSALAIAQTLKYSERKVFTLTPKEALEAAKQLGVANGN
ncbi:putative ribosomal RNA small subunit methyltransferase A [uncultured archaeon]|nr:putative ribosomal RNA small subunit methyltransferase A [uncultured archaeon]